LASDQKIEFRNFTRSKLALSTGQKLKQKFSQGWKSHFLQGRKLLQNFSEEQKYLDF
jgi:hypothetical protein